MATVLGGVDGGDEGGAEAASEVVARHRDEPVVPVDEVEVGAVSEPTPAASMSAFIRSTQATNSPRSRGRLGSSTRWMATPFAISSAGDSSPPRVST